MALRDADDVSIAGGGLMMRWTTGSTLTAVLLFATTWNSAGAQDQPEAELQRVDVRSAGITVSLPADWSVDVEMRGREDWGLSERYEDAAPLLFWNVLYASAGGRPWCDVTWYPQHPMSLDEHALEYELLMAPGTPGVERTIQVVPVALPAGEARHFAIHNVPSATFTSVYMWDMAMGRYFLQCVDDERAPDDWLALAATVMAIASEAPSLQP